MKALSIRQPWAWMIVHGWKDIENRDWATGFRGRFYVQASKGMTRDEYYEACIVAKRIRGNINDLPPMELIDRGFLIGSVEIVDCVTKSESPWFFGKHGFVLSNPESFIPIPCVGALGFFEVPIEG